VFRLKSDSACKHLWRCAVDHHVFFRLSHTNTALHTQSPSRSSSIFRRSRRSTARRSIERHDMTPMTTRRRDMQVKRRPSQRYQPRRATLSDVVSHHNHAVSSNRQRRSSTDSSALSSYRSVTCRSVTAR